MNFLTFNKQMLGLGFRKTVQLWVHDGGASALPAPVFTGQLGRILGTVTDQSGVISGATVAVTDTERGVTKNFITNETREYNAPTHSQHV